VVDKEANVLLVEARAIKGGPLRDLSDRIRQQEKADGAIVVSVDDGRAYLVINFDQSLVERGLDASQLIRELAGTSAAAAAASRREAGGKKGKHGGQRKARKGRT